MRTGGVVKLEPRGDADVRLAAVSIALEVDVLAFEGAPQPLDEHVVHHRPRPSVEMRTPAADSRPVKAAFVNRLPWSVLKISGRPKRESASSSAATANVLSMVLDSRHASSVRLNQSMMIATR